VSVDLVDAVFRQSQATGRTRLVLLALAHSASHENWTEYRQAEAWTFQPRLAEMCGITGKDATREVRRHLEALAELGEIRWTGEVNGRGSKVWELLLDPTTRTYVPGPVGASALAHRTNRPRPRQIDA
jgi:SOS-response transcriptional repressor LexA